MSLHFLILTGRQWRQQERALIRRETSSNSALPLPLPSRYGHAVLRQPDPRFTALSRFCDTRPELKDSKIVELVKRVSQVAPGVLTEHGKTKNPFPNVDAQSGCVLYEYGMSEFKYYTVVFGISRALGALPQLVMDRALGMPIERPKSMSMASLEAFLKK